MHKPDAHSACTGCARAAGSNCWPTTGGGRASRAGLRLGYCARMSTERICSACGRTFEMLEGPTCPGCGSSSTSQLVRLSVAEEFDVAESLSWRKRHGNSATHRRDTLSAEVARLDAAVAAGDTGAAQAAAKAALEAIHELADCLKRQEWTQSAWKPDDLELWRAHIGARNAAHHTSSSVVALHSTGALTWDVDAPAIATLQSSRQQRAYRTRLADTSAPNSLRRIAELVAISVS